MKIINEQILNSWFNEIEEELENDKEIWQLKYYVVLDMIKEKLLKRMK